MSIVKKLEKLSNLNGISGFEDDISKYLKSEFKDNTYRQESDNLGSLAIIKGNTGPKIMIATHVDEIGFIVTDIDKNGFIKFEPVGGWWGHVVLAQKLNITLRNGKIITGIVGSTPPHMLTMELVKQVVKIKDMFLDIGVTSKEEAFKKGINIGDPISPDSTFFRMANKKFLCGKALDNRASVAVGMDIMQKLKDVKHDNTVIFANTVQEEVGLRGARTAAYKWEPDIALAIDVTIAKDQPGIPVTSETALGKGVSFSLFDRTIIANPKLLRYLEVIAKEHKIKFNYDNSTGGGTDAGAIHLSKEGVVTMTLSLPSRYIHSHNAIVHEDDLQACSNLVVEFIKKLTSSEFSKFKN